MLACMHEPQSHALKKNSSLIRNDKLKQRAQWALFHRIQPTNSLYLQTDRPLYKPGDTIWFKTLSFDTHHQGNPKAASQTNYELISPAGETIQEEEFTQHGVSSHGYFHLVQSQKGGVYTLRATMENGKQIERSLWIQTAKEEQIYKKMTFLREAYGPSDIVEATLKLSDISGPLANQSVRILAHIDGYPLPELEGETDEHGHVLIRSPLPATIHTPDATITVVVEKNGLSESITRPIPLVLNHLRVRFYPEGGLLLEGVENRVYFESLDEFGKAADVEGTLVDDLGREITTVRSLRDGLGRFQFTPQPNRNYRIIPYKPAGVKTESPLPKARQQGCIFQTVDDFQSVHPFIQAKVWCTSPQTVVIHALRKDLIIDTKIIKAGPSPSLVTLEDATPVQGSVQITLMNEEVEPVAERLIYRYPNHKLNIEIQSDRAHYLPRENVELEISTTNHSGEPVAAELSLAVVDERLLSYADDRQANLLSAIYLESVLGRPVHNPNRYFDPSDPDAEEALDLLFGVGGYRELVLVNESPPTQRAQEALQQGTLPEEDISIRSTGENEMLIDTTSLSNSVTFGGTSDGTTTIDFEAIDIEFSMVHPSAVLMLERAKCDFNPLIQTREHFEPWLPGENRWDWGYNRYARWNFYGSVQLDQQPPFTFQPTYIGGIGDTDIQNAFHEEAFQHCDTRYFGIRESLVASLWITPKGQTGWVNIKQADIYNKDVRECIVKTLERTRFPSKGTPSIVTIGVGLHSEGISLLPPPAPLTSIKRAFPLPQYGSIRSHRDDFRSILMWDPHVQTNAEGKATVTFPTSDTLSVFRTTVEGFSHSLLGYKTHHFRTILPLSVDVMPPEAALIGDNIMLPILLRNETEQEKNVTLRIDAT
ncbi:MAG: MG2 domain-containing protein, partial [Myxococcota bacterium]|nr:MG2 domain-containing protein [Myxococcota bacterium]